jgi:hypothetical protein
MRREFEFVKCMGVPWCVLGSAYAKASADKNFQLTRRSLGVGGQAQHEGSLDSISVCATANLLILSLSKDAQC